MGDKKRFRLRKRAEFLAVRKGEQRRGPFFLLEARKQEINAEDNEAYSLRPARFGFTVTRKNGNAVIRNRIKRRLREAVRHAFFDQKAASAPQATDYVIVARKSTLNAPFADLIKELERRIRSQ
ncbi:ribonuclease P protein component [Bartonella sp. DGB2]|uniref:ribonuclease P protein component n=1 Tax=Bartonella sp. DGB2 TaxID=3388426 RepID=UPI00398FBCAA